MVNMPRPKRLPGQTKEEYDGMLARGWNPLDVNQFKRYRKSIVGIRAKVASQVRFEYTFAQKDPYCKEAEEAIKEITKQRIDAKNKKFKGKPLPPEIGRYTTRQTKPAFPNLANDPNIKTFDQPPAKPSPEKQAEVKAELQRYIDEMRAQGRPGF